MIPDKEGILSAVKVKTSRSGGKGGQNVNKVSSKVELILHLESAEFLTAEEKELLRERLAFRIDQEDQLHVTCQEDRSQLQNKERAAEKLISLIASGLHVSKTRKPTKIPRGVILKRRSDKKNLSARKETRKRPPVHD